MPTCFMDAETTTVQNGRLDTSITYSDFIYWIVSDSCSYAEEKGNDRFNAYNRTMAPFSVGRIPARTVAECSVYVEKVISFENNVNPRLWYNTAILCADDRFMGTIPDVLTSRHFESAETIWDTTLTDFFSRKVYLSSFLKTSSGSHENARNAFFTNVNSGARWCVYFGHGHPDSLSDEGFLRNSDALRFTNDTTPTMFFSFSCSNADFLRKPESQMCREYLFKPSGGCISYFAASYETYSFDNENLALGLFSQARDTARLSLGRAVLNAFSVRADYNMSFYHILGDPALTFGKQKAALSPAVEVGANRVLTFSSNAAAPAGGQLYFRCEISDPKTTTCIDTVYDVIPALHYEPDSVIATGQGPLNGPLSIAIPSTFAGDKIKFSFYACNAAYEARYDTVLGFSAATIKNIAAGAATRPSVRFSRGIVTVSFFSGNRNELPRLSIYDLQGRLCRALAMPCRNNNAFFDFREANLSQGNYVLRISAAGQVFTEKVFFLR
jgi:hypothetical protein